PARRGNGVVLCTPRPHRPGRRNTAYRSGTGKRRRGARIVVLSGQPARPALLRGARVLRHPVYRRRRQRGADARCALPLGARLTMARDSDRYDRVAADYSRYRPRYPDRLVADLAERIGVVSPAGEEAWVLDIGCG